MNKTDVLQLNLIALTIFNANDTTLTVNECAEFLKVHPNTVKNRIHKNIILADFQDGKYYIPKIQFLKKIIEEFTQKNEVDFNQVA